MGARPTLIPIGLLLAMSGLMVIAPGAQAQTTYEETFETDTLGQDPTADWYTYGEAGTGTQTISVAGNQAYSGSKSLYFNEHATSQTVFRNARFDLDDPACSDSIENDFVWNFAFRIDSFPASGGSFFFGATQTSTTPEFVNGNSQFIGMRVTNVGEVFLYLDGATAAVTPTQIQDLTIVEDTWYPVTMTMECTATERLTVYFPDQALGHEVGPISGVITNFDVFTFTHYTSGAMGDWWIDDFTLNGVDVMGLDTFCSNPTDLNFGGDPDADFGYNFVDSTVTFDASDATQAGFSTGYVMESDDSGGNDPASMGKGWTGDVYTAEVWFRIDAATEGKESNFRAVFSFDAAVPSSSSVGNVRTTGSFADHVAVRLKETGNDWHINLEFASGGNGPFVVGGSFLGLDPNSPQTFIFRVDTRSAGPYLSIRNLAGVDILNESMEQSVGGFDLGAKVDNKLYAQWFVAEGGSATLGDAFTYLDDYTEGSPHNSTCIFANGAFTGSQGLLPSSAVGDVAEEGDVAESTIVTVSPELCEQFGSCVAAQGFQGLIAMITGAGMGGMGTVAAAVKIKARVTLRVVLAAAGGGGFIAVAAGYFIGFIAEWFFILMIVALVAYLVFLGVKTYGGAEQ